MQEHRPRIRLHARLWISTVWLPFVPRVASKDEGPRNSLSRSSYTFLHAHPSARLFCAAHTYYATARSWTGRGAGLHASRVSRPSFRLQNRGVQFTAPCANACIFNAPFKGPLTAQSVQESGNEIFYIVWGYCKQRNGTERPRQNGRQFWCSLIKMGTGLLKSLENDFYIINNSERVILCEHLQQSFVRQLEFTEIVALNAIECTVE